MDGTIAIYQLHLTHVIISSDGKALGYI